MPNCVELKLNSDNAVELLEEWLELAKKGKFRALAVAGVMDDGTLNNHTYDRLTDPDVLIGTLARLQVRIIMDTDPDD